jgi:PilZ domain
MNNERRRNFRVEWNSPATIYDLQRNLARPCILSNFSNTGARITGVLACTVPDEFLLRIKGGRHGTRKCRVLWRDNDTLGAEFTDYETSEADVNHEVRERA